MTEQPSTEMTAMSHETAGFCFCGQMHGPVKDWNEHDWAALRTHAPAGALSAQPVSLLTREQIAEAAYYAEKRADYGDSWGERWEDESEGYQATYLAIADAVLALLSQPTRTPEATWDERNWELEPGYWDRHTEPPRIEDMTPGTFLTVQVFGILTPHRVCVVRGDRTIVKKVDRLDGRSQYIAVADIDPSTIRDVTPPAGDDRG